MTFHFLLPLSQIVARFRLVKFFSPLTPRIHIQSERELAPRPYETAMRRQACAIPKKIEFEATHRSEGLRSLRAAWTLLLSLSRTALSQTTKGDHSPRGAREGSGLRRGRGASYFLPRP